MLRVLTTLKPRIKRSRAPSILRARQGAEQRQAIARTPALLLRSHPMPVHSQSLRAPSLTRRARGAQLGHCLLPDLP